MRLYYFYSLMKSFIFCLTGRKRGEIIESNPTSEEEDSDSTPFRGAKPTDHFSSDERDHDPDIEDSFIVEDGNTIRPDLPAIFSMNTYQDLDHHFKIICQLFVHLAVKPTEVRQEAMTALMKRE